MNKTEYSLKKKQFLFLTQRAEKIKQNDIFSSIMKYCTTIYWKKTDDAFPITAASTSS